MQHSLTRDEVGKYSRQLLVNSFGVQSQEKLKNVKVLILGAGGLGCPVATYLAGSGVGTIGIVDYDHVSEDNLHRQVAHKEQNVGKPKTESLKESIESLNRLVKVICHNVLLNRQNCLEIVKQYDIVADCSDNPATRYLINDACVLTNLPLVSGSALRWDGQLTVYHYGKEGPCYRCLYPCPPDASLVTNCSEGGVLGPVVGIIGCMQALEVIKIASGLEPSYSGKLFLFSGLQGQTRAVNIRKRSPACAVCGDAPTVTELIDYNVFCGASADDKAPSLNILLDDERVSVHDYNELRKNCKPLLIDTRPTNEFDIANLPEAKNLTLNLLKKYSADEIRQVLGLEEGNKSHIYVICHRGNDSQLGVELLRDKMKPNPVQDVRGGYDSWAKLIDVNFPTY
ncbi:unnamed protein product [Auanema sp. JU1783]|nr:unnamed protein product [Auanema sp. JU1783]